MMGNRLFFKAVLMLFLFVFVKNGFSKALRESQEKHGFNLAEYLQILKSKIGSNQNENVKKSRDFPDFQTLQSTDQEPSRDCSSGLCDHEEAEQKDKPFPTDKRSKKEEELSLSCHIHEWFVYFNNRPVCGKHRLITIYF